MEHELGHSKYHNEGKSDVECHLDTPEKKLRGETGYEIQRQIRADLFSNEATKDQCSVIEITAQQRGAPYAGRLNPRLHWTPKEKQPTDPMNFKGAPIMSLGEIAQHMDYPVAAGSCRSSGRAFDDDEDYGADPPDDEPRRKRRKKGPDDPPPPPPSTGSCQSQWLSNLGSLLPDAMNKAQKAIHERLMSIKGTPSDGVDERLTFSSLQYPEEDHREECSIDVWFCNKDRQVQETFSSSEDICVLLNVTNTTAVDMVAPITHNIFGRQGMFLEISGMKRDRVAERPWHLRLTPGIRTFSFVFFFYNGR